MVAEAADGEQAVAGALETRPDLVLMDIRMLVLDGIEATRRLIPQLGATRVVMLTTFDLDDYVVDAFRAGASGFLLKTAPPADRAVRPAGFSQPEAPGADGPRNRRAAAARPGAHQSGSLGSANVRRGP